MEKCVKWVKESMKDRGVISEYKCNKDAPNLDPNGRWLCNRHYKQWLNKINKKILK